MSYSSSRRALAWLAYALISVPVLADPSQPQALERAGEIQPGEPVEWPVNLQAGNYIRGQLGGNADVHLLNGRGAELRWLVKADDLTREFSFMVPASGTYRLRLKGGAVTEHYRMRLQILVPLAEPPAPQAVASTSVQSPALASLASQLASGGNTKAFWQARAVEGSPLIESLSGQPDQRLVTFLWRGAQHNVRLFGAPSGDHDWLTRMGNSDLWYRSYTLPVSTRLSYQLAPDVPTLDVPAGQQRRALLATAQRDPLNPSTYDDQGDPYLTRSRLELPAAAPQPWVAQRPSVARGRVEQAWLASERLGSGRDVHVYRPAGWQPGAKGQGLLVLFDAHAYVRKVPTTTILDNLIAEGAIPPTAALIVANPSEASRAQELPPNADFAAFLAEELLPWARERGVYADAAHTVVAGSSFGGLAAAYAALRYPERFGNVLSLSGSFWWAPPGEAPQWLTREYSRRGRLPLRFFLSAGLFEAGKGGQSILETNRRLRDVLVAKSYELRYVESASGHDYLQWQGALGDGMLWLLGRADGKSVLH